MGFEPDPNLGIALRRRLWQLTAAAAEAGANRLSENLSSTSHGLGNKYRDNPHRSSAPGQYPVLQTGTLHGGVGHDPNALTEGAQVFIEDDWQKLVELEFAPPEFNPPRPPSAELPTKGGRAPLWRTMSDPKTLDEIRDAMRRA